MIRYFQLDKSVTLNKQILHAGSNIFPTITEVLITALLVAAVNLLSWQYQYQISNNDGKGMDGVEYYKMAEDIRDGHKPNARAPFVYRIGTPALAAAISPDNLLQGFRIVNIGAGSVIPFALLIWISLYYRKTLFRLLPVALFSLTWHSPLRLSWYYPVHTDPLSILALIILLILLFFLMKSQSANNIGKKTHTILAVFSFITFAAVFIREICLVPALLYLIVNLDFQFNKNEYLKSKIKIHSNSALVPVIAGIAGIIAVHFLAEQNNSYSFVAAAYSWIYRKSLIMFIHAWLIAFGPILFIIIYKYRDAYNYLKSNSMSAYFLIIAAFMGMAGGSDTERIIYWSMPVVYLLMLNIISNHKQLFSSKIIISIIAIAQLVNMRVFWAIPDYPNDFESLMPVLTPFGSKFPLMDLWTWHGDLKVNLISFAEYIILFIIFAVIIKLYEKRLNKIQNPD